MRGNALPQWPQTRDREKTRRRITPAYLPRSARPPSEPILDPPPGQCSRPPLGVGGRGGRCQRPVLSFPPFVALHAAHAPCRLLGSCTPSALPCCSTHAPTGITWSTT